MIQALKKPVGFDEFLEWYPENSEVRYELRRGVIVEMPKPRGKHSDVAGFLTIEAGILIQQLKAEYFIPKECVVRADKGESAYEPDGIILDRREIANEPNWEKSSAIENGTTIKLIIEVVSTNWRDDYYVKFAAYEALGIREYWIVDYAALGGRRFLDNPKQPVLWVCELSEGEYQMTPFRENDHIISPTFPDLQLTAAQIFQ
ncbi:MAG: Uma2 family endonuclease [Plectolyngbya sp. WJT66-NPBG17]|jgi:Uma2 family endonuclease|nr:Uma2 family endonuclease [Plectolyngbya sp. WJT66-NPBG17]MBW4523923.1 Uma2 family endonuclease [Phormidium tanganyikae FI6-MK23]